DDRERRCAGARDVAQSLPVPVEPRHGRHARGLDAEGAGPAGDAGGGGEATTGERAASAREPEAEGQSRQYASDDRTGGRRLQSPNREGGAGAEHSGEGEDGEDR